MVYISQHFLMSLYASCFLPEIEFTLHIVRNFSRSAHSATLLQYRVQERDDAPHNMDQGRQVVDCLG
jgi:hypothetical protein